MYNKFHKLVAACALSTFCIQGSWAGDFQTFTNNKLEVSSASKGQRTPSNMMIWAYIGPGSYLAKASIEVTDSKGRVVGTGQTGSRGVLLMTVPGSASENEPYMIVTSGGMVDGVPFQGHLKAFVPKLGFGNITYLDPISTTALKMSARSPRTYAANMAKVRNVLGLRYYDDMGVMRLRTAAIGEQELKVKIEHSGGLTKFMDVLAKAAEKGQLIGGLKPAKSSRLPGSTGTLAAANTQAPGTACRYNQNTNASSGSGSLLSWSTVSDYGYQVGRDLIKGWVGDTATNLVEKVAGFALAKGNSGADKTSQQIENNFSAIGKELDCISAQIVDLGASVSLLKLETELAPMKPCLSSIRSEWDSYQAVIGGTPAEDLNSNNANLNYLFNPDSGSTTSAMKLCNSIINDSLLNYNGDTGAAWITKVKNIQEKVVGGNTVTIPNVFLPSDVYNLQVFLSYYSTLQYQQAILTSETFNWQINFLENNDVTLIAKQKMLGNTGCTSSSSPQNPPVIKISATNFCDMQLNLAGVWPQTIFSDEVALCTQCDTKLPNLTGYAIVAVPAKLTSELISPYRDVKQGGRNEGLGGRSSESLAKQDCDVITSPSTMCGTITLTVAPTTGVAEDSGANLIFTFSRTGSTNTYLTVNYTVGGSATLGTDYTGIPSTAGLQFITLPSGHAKATIKVVPTADATFEPDETVSLSLISGNDYKIGTTSAVVGTILNDDIPKFKLNSILVSPNTLAQDCISAGNNHNCDYSMPLSQASDTLIAFNQYTVDSPSDMNQETWSTRLAKRDGVATSDQLTAISGKGNENNLFYVGSFLSSWLNHSNGVPNYSAPPWTLLKANTTLHSNFHDVTTRQCSTIDNKKVCSDITTYTATVSMADGVYNQGNPGYNFTPCNNSTKSCDAGKFPSTPTAAYLLQRSWTSGTGYKGPTQ